MNNLATVQTAVYSALTTAPATYPVYDAVPQGTAKPYIVIGDFDADPDETFSTSTDTTLHLHTWSAYAGKSQTHAMLAFIRARLDGQTIGDAWALSEEFNEMMEDPSSTATARLYHGIARYRVRVS